MDQTSPVKGFVSIADLKGIAASLTLAIVYTPIIAFLVYAV